jgi:hypothetical protein
MSNLSVFARRSTHQKKACHQQEQAKLKGYFRQLKNNTFQTTIQFKKQEPFSIVSLSKLYVRYINNKNSTEPPNSSCLLALMIAATVLTNSQDIRVVKKERVRITKKISPQEKHEAIAAYLLFLSLLICKNKRTAPGIAQFARLNADTTNIAASLEQHVKNNDNYAIHSNQWSRLANLLIRLFTLGQKGLPTNSTKRFKTAIAVIRSVEDDSPQTCRP